jgi:hypothetical protein
MKASLKRLASAEYPVSSDKTGDTVQHTLAVGETNGQSLSLGLAFADIGGSIPHPAAVATHIGRELHVGNN